MTTLRTALIFRRLIDENPTLRMLRADNLPLVAAALSEHLSSPGARIPTEDLHEFINAELDELRSYLGLGDRTAKAYCDDWRNAGIIIRRPASAARGETYELSAAGFDAIRIVDQLSAPQSTVTESRLKALTNALRTLAIDTDPDATKRLEALEQERSRIDAQISRVKRGEIESLDDRIAIERVQDILLQAQGLPADFARVRGRFQELNQELREGLLGKTDGESRIIDEIFRGVDLIEESDEGRTFSAFSRLVRDAESSADFESSVSAVLSRNFTRSLSPAARRAVRSLMRDMKEGSRDVQGTLTDFARGLRRYVRSQDFQRDRALRALLQNALREAASARRFVRATSPTGIELELSALPMRSVGSLQLHDPSEWDAGEALSEAEIGETDLEALALIVRESEIDFRELVKNVNEALIHTPEVSIGEVLTRSPATQGVASVIGLLSLSIRFGRVLPNEVEELSWAATNGSPRTAVVTRHVFTQKVEA